MLNSKVVVEVVVPETIPLEDFEIDKLSFLNDGVPFEEQINFENLRGISIYLDYWRPAVLDMNYFNSISKSNDCEYNVYYMQGSQVVLLYVRDTTDTLMDKYKNYVQGFYATN